MALESLGIFKLVIEDSGLNTAKKAYEKISLS